jgi:uncharacterized protein (DUF2147 family)
MKRHALAAAAALSLTLAGHANAADPVGRWATPSSSGIVEISRCGESLCGRLIGSSYLTVDPSLRDVKNRDASLRGRALKGLPMLRDFKGGPTKWIDGKVYNPDDGATYSGVIELIAADTLKLKGCIVAPFCKSQVWTRVK